MRSRTGETTVAAFGCVSQERASGAQGLNLVNSCNVEHFDLVLIPKLNFENSRHGRSVGCVIPVFARIDWTKIKCIILSSKKEEAGTVTRGIAESAWLIWVVGESAKQVL